MAALNSLLRLMIEVFVIAMIYSVHVHAAPWKSPPKPAYCQWTAVNNLLKNNDASFTPLTASAWDALSNELWNDPQVENHDLLQKLGFERFNVEDGGAFTDSFVRYMLALQADYRVHGQLTGVGITRITEGSPTDGEAMAGAISKSKLKDMLSAPQFRGFLLDVNILTSDGPGEPHSTAIVKNAVDHHYYYLDSNEQQVVPLPASNPKDITTYKSTVYWGDRSMRYYQADKSIDLGTKANLDNIVLFVQGKLERPLTNGGASKLALVNGRASVGQPLSFDKAKLLEDARKKSCFFVAQLRLKNRVRFADLNNPANAETFKNFYDPNKPTFKCKVKLVRSMEAERAIRKTATHDAARMEWQLLDAYDLEDGKEDEWELEQDIDALKRSVLQKSNRLYQMYRARTHKHHN